MRKVLHWETLTVERKETTLAYLRAVRNMREAGLLPAAKRCKRR